MLMSPHFSTKVPAPHQVQSSSVVVCGLRHSRETVAKGDDVLQVFCRTDYQIATPGIAQTAREASIYKTARFSDHAPLTVDYLVDF